MAIWRIIRLLAKMGFTLYQDYKIAKQQGREQEWNDRIQKTERRVTDADAEGVAGDLNNFFGPSDDGNTS